MGEIKAGDRRLWTPAEVCKAIYEHNFVTEPQAAQNPDQEQAPARVQEPTPEVLAIMDNKVRRALAGTSSSSAPGPDGINYKLLRMIKDTALGSALIRAVAIHLLAGTLPEEWKEMRVVMIPKPGKDHKQVNAWRPIVLAQTLGKLWDKVVADGLQETATLHWGQMGSRKGYSATDGLMWIVGKTQEAIARGGQARIRGMDVK